MTPMARRAWGTGSLHQRKDGRWIGSLEVHDGRGGRHRQYVTGLDRAVVRRRLAELARSTRSPRPMTAGTVARLLERWLEHVRPNVRPGTWQGWERMVRLHVSPAIGGHRVSELGVEHTEAMLRGMRTVRGTVPSPQVRKHALTVLRLALKQGQRWGVVERNVASLVTGPRIDRTPVEPLDDEQVATFLASVRDDPWYALYVVGLHEGLRVSELLALRWEDADLDGGWLDVRFTLRRVSRREWAREPPKTGTSRRRMALTATAVRALREHRKRQAEELLRPGRRAQGFVFARPGGSPLDRTMVTKRFQRALAAAGLPRKRFHDARHTSAARLLDRTGGDLHAVKEWLGHSAIATTTDLYGHLAERAKRRLADIMDDDMADKGSETA